MKPFKLIETSAKYLLVWILLTSGKPSFDLMDLQLNTTNINDLINKNFELKDQILLGKTYKITHSQKMLTINNLQLKNQGIDSTRSNHLWLEYNKEDSIIIGYQLVFYTDIKDPKIVFEKFKEKMGVPNYRHYADILYAFEDDDAHDFDGAVWEDKENKTFYLLRYTNWDGEIRELRLNAMINSDQNLDDLFFFSRPFSCWKNYIIARNEMNKPNYTYQEFAKSQGGKYREHTK